MPEESHIEKVLLYLSGGPMRKQELELELGSSLPQVLFTKGLVTPPNRDGYIKLTKRGTSALNFLTSVREISTLEPELEYMLTSLEKMEEELINLGFYDVITTPEQLARKLGVSAEDARKNLEELSKRMYVLRLYDEQGNLLGYRSRIAEITRLISYLKQRFSEDDIYDAPNLVSSVKLRIRDRYVTRRSKPVEDLLNELEGYVLEQFLASWKIVKDVLKAWLNYVGIEKVSNFQRETTLDIFSVLQRMHVGQLETNSIALVAETGAGKTEAYFIPFVTYLLLRKSTSDVQNAKKARLIIVYPRVALSLNQLARFTRYLYCINREIRLHPEFSKVKLHIGIDNESIPRNYNILEKNQEIYSNFWSIHGDRAYYERLSCPVLETLVDKIKFECCRGIYYDTKNGKFLCGEGHELPIKLFKDQVYHSDVDIVIMTPNTLMRRLFEYSFVRFLENTDILVLAFDECHLYSSLPGAHTALIFRRLFRLVKRLGIKTIVLGISATMSSAEEFFKELVLIKPKVITPKEDELERKSVEYYLFVKPEVVSIKRAKINMEDVEEDMDETEEELKPIKPLSTMIQTLMCVMHNMRRTPLKNKGLGFVDSIDTLHRWYYAQKDAEDRMLFRFRTKKMEKCQKCKNGPIISCPEYLVGECWYFAKFDEVSLGLDKPVDLQIYYSERREELQENKDCILSTSALEVGYDDPTLIAFFQYKGPRSLISFAQRKGRVARSPEDRPISVLVLSPYSPRDNFIFINDDHILSSEYNEIPLNSENYFAQAAHAKASVIDYLAYKNPSLRVTYETPISVIRNIFANFLQNNEKEIIEWIGSVASIYKYNHILSRRLIEKLWRECQHE